MPNNTAIVNAEPNTAPLQLPEETESLIKASIAENTLKAYQRALQSLTVWLSGRTLSDALLANYITALHETGKSPATIGQVVATVKWQLKHQFRNLSTSLTRFLSAAPKINPISYSSKSTNPAISLSKKNLLTPLLIPRTYLTRNCIRFSSITHFLAIICLIRKNMLSLIVGYSLLG